MCSSVLVSSHYVLLVGKVELIKKAYHSANNMRSYFKNPIHVLICCVFIIFVVIRKKGKNSQEIKERVYPIANHGPTL